MHSKETECEVVIQRPLSEPTFWQSQESEKIKLKAKGY